LDVTGRSLQEITEEKEEKLRSYQDLNLESPETGVLATGLQNSGV